jgi:hypothetical protein
MIYMNVECTRKEHYYYYIRNGRILHVERE